ncbi:ThiF family adenylyltransferase [Actinophytocola sp.]|uniref:HesA/MoeB/ThiF family protein n=1 Tax=Actinophytocola sp. TaxID=1872138 RepID=UPI002D80C02B|nr:ThiF family adenylyltransferase [Actinophytocola sp.]HET9137908.1 ThiF family adenylyltransferase [Actinophytocola sp.]
MEVSVRHPRIKREHQPVLLGGGRIRIGGHVPGIARDVLDPDGWVWAMLEALDGSRSVEQVISHVVSLFPTKPKRQVRAAIEDFVQAGYVEDAGESPPADLTVAEVERYSRGRALFSWMDLVPRRSSWDAQLQLRQARVVVVGLGGVGGAAALALTLSGVGHIHCVEPDVVELSNLNRQILFTDEDIGKSKVDAAMGRLRAYNSGAMVTGEQTVVDTPGVLRALAVTCDVLLLAADQPLEIRSWTNRVCHATGTAWVHGGYHGPQVVAGLYRPGAGPCYECARVTGRPPRAAQRPRAGMHAANAVSANLAGLLAAHAAMSLITGVPALRVGSQFGFNLVTLRESVAGSTGEPRPDCPTCGQGGA